MHRTYHHRTVLSTCDIWSKHQDPWAHGTDRDLHNAKLLHRTAVWMNEHPIGKKKFENSSLLVILVEIQEVAKRLSNWVLEVVEGPRKRKLKDL